MRQLTSWNCFVEDSELEDPSPTDAELLARWCASADRNALEQLIRRHGGMVFGVCRRILGDTPDADDAFQAVFLILVKKSASLAHPEQVAGWLHGVAMRVARKARANRTRRYERESMMVEPVAPVPPDHSQDLRALDEELERLPDKYRLPILLCELEGRTLEEAARQLGWPKGTVAGRLSRGRELLRQRLARRRCGLVLPLGLTGLDSVPDPLVTATVEAGCGAAAPASGSVALAEAILREWSRGRFGLALVLILTAGVIAALAWHARPISAEQPAAPASSGCCHKAS